MFYFDPLYLVFAIPPVLFGLWAQWRVHSAVSKYSQIPTSNRMTGAEIGRYLLDSEGLTNVQIEPAPGALTDHYDPRGKVLRLSEVVYGAPTIAAAATIQNSARGHVKIGLAHDSRSGSSRSIAPGMIASSSPMKSTWRPSAWRSANSQLSLIERRAPELT